MLSLQDHVHFVKAWSEKAWSWMASFDLFVLPSLNEGMGRVLIEAMALAKPVVASRVGGIPEIVVDGETGNLVPAKDAKRLAEAILFLLKDAELCRRMGEAGKKRADSRFSAYTMVRRIGRLYQELLKEEK
jgi:glycosyltransferase involved in cell wall biosynthesis